MPRLPARYTARTCRACHWQLLITCNWGESGWSAANAHTSTGPYTHKQAQTNAHVCTNTDKQTRIRLHGCVFCSTSLPHFWRKRKQTNKKNPNTRKALIRLWTMTRVVCKLGEIWVGTKMWQLAGKEPKIRCHIYSELWLGAVWQTI